MRRIRGWKIVFGLLLVVGVLIGPVVAPSYLPPVLAQTGVGIPANLVRSPIGYSSLDPSVLQQLVVTITAAQVKALNSTPITLVAGAGAGKFLESVSCITEFQFVTTQYTGSYQIVIQVNGVTLGTIAQSINMNNFVVSQMATISTFGNIISNALPASTTLNAPIILTALTGNPATGDGTLLIHLQYRVHSGF